MPTFFEQFYQIDPFNPPPGGTALQQQFLQVSNVAGAGSINTLSSAGTTPTNGDRIDGSDITAIYYDTIRVTVGSSTIDISGATFYLADGRRFFSPLGATNLEPATFVSTISTSTTNVAVPVASLGPPCFTPGALILTPGGERPVEDLRPGDLVVTRDRGAQPVLWAGGQEVDGTGDFAPVLIRAGALGNRRDLLVSPQHRLLIRGWRAELFAGLPEAMVAAVHLVNGRTVVRAPRPSVTYLHFMLERHEIVFAEGAQTESLDPAGEAAAADRAILRLAAGAAGSGRVRPALRAWEGRALAL
jgi:hypothetical protein